MEDFQEHFMGQEEFNDGDKPLLSPFNPPFRPTRLHIQRSSICSRAYFVVVMVFFHVYILNVIGLLLYVHYNNGPGDLVSRDGATSASVGDSGSPLPHTAAASPSGELHVEDYSQSYSLPRIEGIRVGHVQQVSLVPDKTHEMRTISLKPLLFGISLIDHQAVPLHCARYKEGPATWVLSCHVPYTGGISFQPQFNAGADLPT